jgi:hypothetical protein
MRELKIVDETFKPRKAHDNVIKLLDEIEELKERLAEETRRADEFYDQLERLREGNDDEDILISRDEYSDLNAKECFHDEIVIIQNEVKEAMARQELGIITAKDELQAAIERLIEVEL